MEKINEINKMISNFIPIVLILLLVVVPEWVMTYANTILGKLFAVAIIVNYTNIDMLQGLLVCAVVIMFYQLTFYMGYDGRIMQYTENNDNNNNIVHENDDNNDNATNPNEKLQHRVMEERELTSPKTAKDWLWTAWNSDLTLTNKTDFTPFHDNSSQVSTF